MKLNKILITTAIALVGAVSANASMTYNAGDMILGFSLTGATTNYELNLGSASQLTLQTWSYQLSTLDLATVLGSTWITSAKVGLVAAGTDAGSTVLGQPVGTTWISYKTTATPDTQPETSQSAAISAIGSLTAGSSVSGGFANQTNNVNDVHAVSVSTSLVNSWTKLSTGGFGIYTSSMFVTTGATSSVSFDVYEMGYDTATKEGTMTLNDSGLLTYVAAVPEPSTYAMFSLGGLGLMALLRRRTLSIPA